MRKLLVLAIVPLLLIGCNETPKKAEEVTLDKGPEITMTTEELLSFLDNLENEEVIKSKVDSLQFYKVQENFYQFGNTTSHRYSMHWIRINKNPLNFVSFHTADKPTWERLKSEIDSFSTGKEIHDDIIDTSFLHKGDKYTFITHQPDMVDVRVNKRYEIVALYSDSPLVESDEKLTR